MSKKEIHCRPCDLPDAEEIPPWASPASWREANQAIQKLCALHRNTLGPAVVIARTLAASLDALFPILDDLCRQTCPWCQAPCCQVATVWFDYKDLVFIHLAGAALPLAQLVRKPGELCRCCGPSGCQLPRISRPWTCSWYLCPPQKNLLTALPGITPMIFADTVAAIKQTRTQLEAEFLRATS